MPLDLTQDNLGCLFIRWILEGSLGCMVSPLREDTGMWLPQGITSSIHGL